VIGDRAIAFVLLGFVLMMAVLVLLLGAVGQWTIALPLLATAAALSCVALVALRKQTNG
jgi:hypothetical protein